MEKNILEIQNLTKYYGKTKGVESLSLKLEEGENFITFSSFTKKGKEEVYEIIEKLK